MKNQKGRMMRDMGRSARTAWMKPEEFRAIRESLGYTQTEFAKALDTTSTSVSAYEVGRVPIPKTLMMLMTAIKTGKIRLK